MLLAEVNLQNNTNYDYVMYCGVQSTMEITARNNCMPEREIEEKQFRVHA
jgi:hypothetical protein